MTITEASGELDLIITRVTKLWRKANDPAATEAEREAFETKALAMMEAHRLTEAMLDLGYDDVIGDWQLIELKGRNARIQIDLIDAVARAYDSRTYWEGYGLSYRVIIFGFKSDFNRIKALTTLLVNDALTGAAKLQGYNASNTLALRRGFVQGYTTSIGARLRDAKRAARDAEQRLVALKHLFGDEVDADIDWSGYEAEIAAAAAEVPSSAALVLADKAKRVDDLYGAKRMRRAASVSSGHSAGYSAGREAGNQASLSTANRIAPSRKGLNA